MGKGNRIQIRIFSPFIFVCASSNIRMRSKRFFGLEIKENMSNVFRWSPIKHSRTNSDRFGGCFTFHMWLIYCVIAFIFFSTFYWLECSTSTKYSSSSSIIKKLCNSDKVDICSTVCTGEIKMAVVFPSLLLLLSFEKSKNMFGLKVELCQQFYVFVICKTFFSLVH